MKQFLENIFKATIKDVFSNKVSNSNNKTEFHFHGPVNLIQGNSKRLKNKT
jgi:hypothetical protein